MLDNQYFPVILAAWPYLAKTVFIFYFFSQNDQFTCFGFLWSLSIFKNQSLLCQSEHYSVLQNEVLPIPELNIKPIKIIKLNCCNSAPWHLRNGVGTFLWIHVIFRLWESCWNDIHKGHPGLQLQHISIAIHLTWKEMSCSTWHLHKVLAL